MTAVGPDLDVDANGDGMINEDDDEIEMTIGGLILFNCDNDTDALPTTDVDCNDAAVNGSDDAADLAELLVHGIDGLPSGRKVALEISEEAAENIRIFSSRAPGALTILGRNGTELITRYEIPLPASPRVFSV